MVMCGYDAASYASNMAIQEKISVTDGGPDVTRDARYIRGDKSQDYRSWRSSLTFLTKRKR